MAINNKTQKETILLRYKEPSKNSDKFYIMERDTSKITWKASWGRQGSKPQIKDDYPISQWHTKLNEKLKKGYKQISDEIVEKVEMEKLWELDGREYELPD